MKLFFVFILSIVSASGFENESPEERWERYVQVLREYGPDEKNIMVSNDTPRLLQYKFECDILAPSATKPDSVHKLRPADIDIVAALGDSLTAANGAGASNPFQVLIEYRGLSWSIGGDNTLEDGTLTLSNILKMYNPNVKGWSIETGPADNHNISRLNVAVPGSTSIDMLEQVETLIQGLKTVKTLDYDNDWKLVTLFIGGNDLCAYCRDNDSYSAEQYATNVKAALDLMHVEMPRTFVNLAQTVMVTEINKLDGLVCNVLHAAMCSCAKESLNDDWEEVFDLAKAYHRSLEMLVEDGRYDTRDDFTVVIQPFFEETYIPPDGEGGWDGSMFAPDCFHFSEYGHQGCAMSLWNNMIERVGEKRKAWLPEDKLECPSEDFEYFYTYKNSNETEQNMDPIGDLDPIGQAYVVTMPSLTLLLTVMVIHAYNAIDNKS